MAAEAPGGDFGQVVEAGRLTRLVARVAVLLAAALLAILKTPFHALGVVAGGLLVEVNLDLFLAFARSARPGRLTVPLWVSVLKFNLAFALTLAACFLVVRFRLGHPLGFLLGLSVFVPSVLAGILLYWRAHEKRGRAAAPARDAGSPPAVNAPPPAPAGDPASAPSNAEAAASGPDPGPKPSEAGSPGPDSAESSDPPRSPAPEPGPDPGPPGGGHGA